MANEETPNPLRRLEDLVGNPREDLGIEIKNWLDLENNMDKANLAQALLAMANSGGGFVLLGFQESESEASWVPDPDRPNDLSKFSQDSVSGIVQRYADPPFHCDVDFVSHPDTGGRFPVITVPGGHRVPIRARRAGPDNTHVKINSYYIRRPGPKSEPIQTAQEWDELLRRCLLSARDDLLENFRTLLQGPASLSLVQTEQKNSLERWIEAGKARAEELWDENLTGPEKTTFPHGRQIIAYEVIGEMSQVSSNEMRDVLSNIGGYTGWRPWWVPTSGEISPYLFNDMLECWIGKQNQDDPAHADFWLASPEGKMFLMRGFQEDSLADGEGPPPGTIFDLDLPVWGTGEYLLHSEHLAFALVGEAAVVNFQITWEGLGGRILTSWANPLAHLFSKPKAVQNQMTSRISVNAKDISANLPEFVEKLTLPLYELFDFFTPPKTMIQEELAKMLRRKRKR